MRMRLWIAATLVCVTTIAASVRAQDLAGFEKRTTVKVLPNGLTLIVCERPEAPVFSFYTLVDAGSADDPQGQSGLAHMFEHMAFKGTDKIGTSDYAAEKPALNRRLAMNCGCANSCNIHGHAHANAWASVLPIEDLKSFWGALGCACWAV